MGSALYWIVFSAALTGLFWTSMIGVAKLARRTATVDSRSAERARTAIPVDALPVVAYARGYSGDVSLPTLLGALVLFTIFFVPGIVFLRRHPPVELVATRADVFVVRPEHPLLGGRSRVVRDRKSRAELRVVRRWRHGAAVVSIGSDRHWLWPGHLDALLEELPQQS